MDRSTFLQMVVLCGAAGILVVIAHLTFGRWWANSEWARRALGWLLILGVCAAGTVFGIGGLDLTTLIRIGVVAAAAGAVLGTLLRMESHDTWGWVRRSMRGGQNVHTGTNHLRRDRG